jgi:hypothetical protein
LAERGEGEVRGCAGETAFVFPEAGAPGAGAGASKLSMACAKAGELRLAKKASASTLAPRRVRSLFGAFGLFLGIWAPSGIGFI